MSIGRIGAVGFGILASLALTAGPSWAAKVTNPNAKLCREYQGALFARDGSSFKNTSACVKYAERGGQLGGVDVVAEPPLEGSFKETCTGFGLEPSTATSCGATYSNGAIVRAFALDAADGTASVSTTLSCSLPGGTVVSLFVLVFDSEGSRVEGVFPPPSGC